MNPIVYIRLKNSNDCSCGSDEGWYEWGSGFKEFINPRLERNMLYVTAIGDNGKMENKSKRLDCFHVGGRSDYDYVNLTFKFKNGEERKYDLTKQQELADCLQMLEEYVANGNELEAQSKFEVNNEVEFMDIQLTE